MNTARVADINRKTKETDIRIQLNLDGTGKASIHTGIGFFDHMLELFARHGGLNIELEVKGDLHVDPHHTIEDVGICLGQAIDQAIGDKHGIHRYGWAYVPMDEALVRAVLDLSGRPFLVYDAPAGTEMVGGFPVEMMEDFWRAFSVHGRCNLHLQCLYGRNRHHILEAMFKATAQALAAAVSCRENDREIPSTKGML